MKERPIIFSAPMVRAIDAKHADECVDAAVRAHPDGLTLEEIALLLGKSRERIRQIERAAQQKELRDKFPKATQQLPKARVSFDRGRR